MLTGPGGPFEVATEEVRGIPMRVFKQRMQSLREIPALARQRSDDETFIVYGDRRYGFAEFVDLANSVSSQLTKRFGIEAGDRVAVLSANNPEWCLAFWGTVDLGAILVGLNGWWKTDEILYGLEDSGAKVLVADRGRFERIADQLDSLPDLEAVFLIDADPADFGGGPDAAPLRRAARRALVDACPTRRSTKTSPRSSSTRAARPAGPRAPSRRTGR